MRIPLAVHAFAVVAKFYIKALALAEQHVHNLAKRAILLLCRFDVAVKLQRRSFGHKPYVSHTHIGIHSVRPRFLIENLIYFAVVNEPRLIASAEVEHCAVRIDISCKHGIIGRTVTIFCFGQIIVVIALCWLHLVCVIIYPTPIKDKVRVGFCINVHAELFTEARLQTFLIENSVIFEITVAIFAIDVPLVLICNILSVHTSQLAQKPVHFAVRPSRVPFDIVFRSTRAVFAGGVDISIGLRYIIIGSRPTISPFVKNCQRFMQLVINLRKVFFYVLDALSVLLQKITHIIVFCRESRYNKIVLAVLGVDVFDGIQLNGDNAATPLIGFHFRKDIQPSVIHTHDCIRIGDELRQLRCNFRTQIMIIPVKRAVCTSSEIERVKANDHL